MSAAPDPLTTSTAMLELVNTPTRAALIARIRDLLLAGEAFSVATLNLDHVVKLRSDAAFRAAYAAQTLVVADGRPIVWLRRLMGQPVELVPGSTMTRPLMALAAEMRMPVALLGATEETLTRARTALEAAYPDLQVVACIAPPMGFDPDGSQAGAALDEIATSGARLCFLALGAPKQERLAARGLTRVPGCGFISVGAGLDFVAGTQTRAPRWVQAIAMEWLWRLARNPRRLTRRYASCFAILPGLAISASKARPHDVQS